jgi:hypothetical protein
MKNFNQVPFFLVTGACASGKSYFVKELKEYFSYKNILVHDFDEKLKLSKEEAIDFFLKTANENWLNKNFTVICGGIVPTELKNSKLYNNFKLYACLLNVDPSEREKRLLERSENFFSAVNKHNFTKQEIINSIISGAEVYKNIIRLADEFVELDNTNKNDPIALKKLVFWIEQIAVNYENNF